MGDRLINMRGLEDRFLGDYTIALRNTPLQKLNPQELRNLMQAIEGRAVAMNPRVESVMQAWMRLARADAETLSSGAAQVLRDAVYDTTTGARLRDPQWKPFTPVPNYYPRMIDTRQAAKLDPQALAQAIQRANPKMAAADVGEMAVGLQSLAKGQGIPATVGENAARLLRRGEPGSPHLHERTGWVIPDEILTRPNEAMLLYARNMAREKAALQTFGPRDAAIEQAIQAAQQTRRPDAHLAVELWDRLRGRYQESRILTGVDQIQRILGNTATTMLLGVPTAVKQLSQVGMAAGQIPVRSLAHGIAKAFTRGGRLEARRFGALVDDITDDLVAVGGLREGAPASARKLDMIERATSRAARQVVKKTGIATLDELARVMTFQAAKHDLLGMQRTAALGKQSAIHRLNQAGLTAASTPEQVANVAKRITDRVNLRTDPIDLPVFLYKPGLSFLRQLNSFNIAVVKRIGEDYIGPLKRAVAKREAGGTFTALKNIAKLGVATGVTGEALGDVLRWIAGRADDRPGGTLWEFADDLAAGRVPAKVIMARIADNLMFAGITGYLQNVKEAMMVAGSPQEARARLYGTVLGAGFSNIGELGAHAANLVTKEFTGTEKQKATARAQAARAVVRRVPVVGGLVAPHLPATKGSDERRAANAIARARARGDYQEAADWVRWYRERQGGFVSHKALQDARSQYAQ